MTIISRRKVVGILAAAATVAFAVTAYGNQAVGRGNGTGDPTATIRFERAAVDGRQGCDKEAWPYIAPECLAASDEHVRPVRRI